MDVTVRRETEKDHEAVFELVRLAFENAEYGDHDEQFLVERSGGRRPSCPSFRWWPSRGRIVGHIMLTELVIETEKGEVRSLTLAPVSVLPECQKGSAPSLLSRACRRQAPDYGSVLLVGHAHYYPRFGFRRASGWGIRALRRARRGVHGRRTRGGRAGKRRGHDDLARGILRVTGKSAILPFQVRPEEKQRAFVAGGRLFFAKE